jgi:enoyl-CoA hydratase/carnithine racemase
MIPGVAGTQTTPRLLGVGAALDLLLTGRALTAAEAARAGIVARVVAPARLMPTAIDLARRLCQLPQELVARVKRAVSAGLDMSVNEGLDLEKRLSDMDSFSR